MYGKYIIVDLDGTLVDSGGERAELAKARRWDEFHQAGFNANARPAELLLVRAWIEAGGYVIVVTGRPEKYRHETVKWLEDHGIHARYIFMRMDAVMKDDVFKENVLRHIQKLGIVPEFVLEDRDHVVAMWRRNGLVCFQAKSGDY